MCDNLDTEQISLSESVIADVHLPKTSWKAVPQPWTGSKHWSPKLLLFIKLRYCDAVDNNNYTVKLRYSSNTFNLEVAMLHRDF